MLAIAKVTTVLILMPDKHLGNLLVSLAAIEAIKQFFAGKRVFLVIDSTYRDLIESTVGLENVLFYPRRQLTTGSPRQRFQLFAQFVWRLRRLAADLALDLEGGNVPSLLAYLSGARWRVGPASTRRSFLLNHKVELSPGRHRIYAYLDIVSALGIPSEPKLRPLRATPTNRDTVAALLTAEGIALERPLVCLHPGAGKDYKQWSSPGFAEVADWLSAQGCQVILIGARGDRNKLDEIRSLLTGHYHDFSERLSLGELIALFELSSLMIGNDSGPMHLAAVTGTPVIALFGPTDEMLWGPLSERAVIVRGSEACDPGCRRGHCQQNFRCMRSLTPEQVIAAAHAVLL